MNLLNICRLVLLCTLGLTFPACSSTPPAAGDQESEAASLQAFANLLDAQVAAWNRGDIQGFMQGYWQSDSLRFASGGTVRRGWDDTLARYLSTYPDRSAMGQLAFEVTNRK